MTRPVGTAAVEIVADATKFGAQLQRDANRALNGLDLDTKPIADQLSAAFTKGAEVGGNSLNQLGRTASTVLSGISEDGVRAFDLLADEARIAGAEVGDALAVGAAGVSDVLANELEDGLPKAVAAGDVVGAAAADALAKSVSAGVDGVGADAASKIQRDALGRFVAGQPAMDAAGKQLGSAVAKGAKSASDDASHAGTFLATSLRTGLLAGLTALGTGVAALTIFGLKSAGAIEQTKISLDSLTGSVAQGQKTFAELQQFAAATPFELPQVTTVAQQFLAFSHSIGQTQADLIPFLTTLGDVASVTGAGADGMQRVALALGQIASAGRLSVGDVRQVATNLPGFNAVAAIAAARGESTAQAMQDISSGSISAQDGISALLAGMKQFPGAAGAMEKQSETLLGVLSTFADVTRQALSDAFAPVIPQIKASLAQITPIVGQALDVLAPELGKVVAQLLPFLGSLLQGLVPILAPVASSLADALAALGPAVKPLGVALGLLVAAAAPLVAPLARVAGVILTALGPGLAALLPIAANAATLFGGFLGAAEQFIQPLSTILAAILTPLGSVAGSLSDLLQGLSTALTEALLPILATLVQIGPSLGQLLISVVQLSPALLSLLIPALQLALALFTPLLPLIPPLASLLSGVLVAAVTAVTGVVNVLAVPLGWLAGFFKDNPAEVYFLVGAFGAWLIASNAVAIATGILQFAVDAATLAVTIFEGAMALLTSPIFLIVAGIALLVGGLIYAYTHFKIVHDIVNDVGHAFAVAGEAIWHALLTAVNAVGSFFAGIGHFFATLPANLAKLATDIGHGFVAALDALPGLITAGLAAAGRAAVTALAALGNALLIAIGVAIGVILASMIGIPHLIVYEFFHLPEQLAAVFTAIGHAVTGAITFIGHEAIAGFTFLFTEVYQGLLSLGNFLISTGASVLSFLIGLPAKIGSALLALPGILVNAFASAWAAAKHATIDGINNVITFLAGLPSKIAALGPKLVQAGANLIAGFFRGLGDVGGFIVKVGGDIVAGLKNGLNNIIDKINDGIGKVDADLPFSLPRIPKLARGGLTQGGGLFELHPTEAVLPLEDARTTDLLARAIEQANAQLRAAATPAGGTGDVYLSLWIGDEQIKDIVAEAMDENNRRLKVRVMAGTGRRR